MKTKYTIWTLTLLTLFSSALLSIFTPMAEELSLALSLGGEEQVAFINSVFLIVGALTSLVWAIMGDKFSRKILLLIATAEWSILILLTTFATDFTSLLILQIFTAIGFGAILPLVFSLIVDLVEPKKRGSMFGILSAVYVVGNGLGQILSGFLIDVYPWFVPLIIVALGGFTCAILLIFIQEPLRGVNDEPTVVSGETVEIDYKIKSEDLKKIWQRKSTIWILILNFVIFVAIGAVSSFFISMLKNDFNLSSTLATIFLIVVFGTQIPSGPIFGKLGDKKRINNEKGRMIVVMICLISGSICYLTAFILATFSQELIMAIVFIFIILLGAFLFGGVDPLTQATLGETNPPQVRSTIYSVNFLAYTFGRSISLILLAYFFVLFNDQYSPGYIILTSLALLSNLILIPILIYLPRDIQNVKINPQ